MEHGRRASFSDSVYSDYSRRPQIARYQTDYVSFAFSDDDDLSLCGSDYGFNHHVHSLYDEEGTFPMIDPRNPVVIQSVTTESPEVAPSNIQSNVFPTAFKENEVDEPKRHGFGRSDLFQSQGLR